MEVMELLDYGGAVDIGAFHSEMRIVIGGTYQQHNALPHPIQNRIKLEENYYHSKST